MGTTSKNHGYDTYLDGVRGESEKTVYSELETSRTLTADGVLDSSTLEHTPGPYPW